LPDATSAVEGYFRIIAFATAAGRVATDGDADHSPYTQSLLRFLPQQGLEVTEIFRQAAADVQRDTGGEQRPEYVVQTSRPLFLRIPYVTDCDREAIEGQNFLGIAGIPFDDINAAKAIPACEAALKQLPDSARINNNITRAYEKAERLRDAFKHYKISADAGYAPAINALGIMYLSGYGLPGPDIETGIKLVTNARALGNLSARASLTSHDLLPHIGEDGRKQLATKLRDRGLTATPARADVATLREPLAAFQQKNNLANKGLTLETVNALGLYAVVPQKFKCH
jgi:TPR repeat protein